MGQTLRRAVGRLPRSVKTGPSPPQSIPRNTEELSPAPTDGTAAVQDALGVSSLEDISRTKVKGDILEERDPAYDVMLQKMSGTIKSKPGGKLEMGEAIIVQKYKRPLPKVRSSKTKLETPDQKPTVPGTLTIAQVQEIMILKQGKSTDQIGPTEIHDISKRFGVDAALVEKIVQFVSLPSEGRENGGG
ncbi:hypothetical protein KSP39_PZI002171 [Platanthera zijinensis]|uniref:NADH dehydrogenase [ubiquinone] 1 alpha subcomplex assembly factor 4 n=1 Tax=Platanthera zijinensis TaxID=2320716 RepID=A0AAP0BZI2_9ASPA